MISIKFSNNDNLSFIDSTNSTHNSISNYDSQINLKLNISPIFDWSIYDGTSNSIFTKNNYYWDSITFYYENNTIIDKTNTAAIIDNSILSYQATLNESRNILGLNISVLSQLLNVSRPTIYSYLNGNDQKDKSADDVIIKLNSILKIVKEQYNLESFSSIFKIRDNNGNTLINYILEKSDKINMFVNQLCKEEIKKQEKRKHIINSKNINFEKYSIPISIED
ncbi:MAG: hypothetical protein EOL97_11015 [Spirochaetia bacterium]|nr:hypothetical protein [Spirochaetia bacterium]